MDRWLVRLVRAGAIALAGLLLLADLAFGAWLAAASGVVVAVLALVDADVLRRTVAAAAVSAAGTAAAATLTRITPARFADLGNTLSFGLAEAAGLGLLLVLATRHLPGRHARWVVPALSAVTVVLPLRMASDHGALMVLLAFCVALAVALGMLLRSLDQQRMSALSRVRSDERLSLARDLHDSVAHHVTGIVVRAQAAQVVASGRPEEAAEALAAIEREGLATLTSMRRLVGVLRDDDAERGPPPGLAQIGDLVARFNGTGRASAVLSASPAAAGADIPDEVGQAVHRVVQEALTNVRRHAVGATRVAVDIDVVDGVLQVRVTDDGQGPRRHWSLHGGYGIAGLRERMTALGGWLTAGQRDGSGWQLIAAMPLSDAGERTRLDNLPPPGSAPQVAP